MRVHGVTSTLVFGAAAAITLVFFQHLAAPLIGSTQVLALHLMGCTVTYAVLLGSSKRCSLRNGAAAFAGVGVVALVSSGIGPLAVGLASVVALVRSGLEFSMRPARAFVVEIGLLVLGLGFASWIASPGWLGAAAALWGFALVQSLYFLVPGCRTAHRCAGIGDPFDRARDQILRLLEESRSGP